MNESIITNVVSSLVWTQQFLNAFKCDLSFPKYFCILYKLVLHQLEAIGKNHQLLWQAKRFSLDHPKIYTNLMWMWTRVYFETIDISSMIITFNSEYLLRKADICNLLILENDLLAIIVIFFNKTLSRNKNTF